MTTRSVLYALGLLVLLSSCALASPLTITFTSSLLPANPGQTVTFSATIANTGATSVFLNADILNISAPLISNDTKFFLNTPPALTPGQSITAPIFDVTAPFNTPPGLYAGNFTILGGSTPSELTNVGSANFAVAVPEPDSLMLLMTGTIMFLLVKVGSAAVTASIRAAEADNCTLRKPG
jgi:hypothetical protein